MAAVVIALFIPLMVPGLRDHKLFSGGGRGGRELVALPNPLVQMNSELRQKVPVHVLTYQTTDPSPQYLQVYVLSNLTTNTWTLAGAPGEPVKDGKLPVTPGLSRTTHSSTQTTKITLARGLTTGPRQASFLPLPYPARSVSVAGDWRSDPRSLTMFSAQSLSGLSYTTVSREVSPTPQQLQLSGEIPDSISTNYLSVPNAFQPLKKLAERITSKQGTFYGEAVALQRWFTESGKFTYSLNVHQPDTAKALINFLTKDRQGYCQQFAFAMAVLARLLDIPSRVAVGYTEGSPIGHERWDVRTSDAHAWPELYFQGAGWLRFEPTPSGSDGQATARQPAYTLPPLTAVPGGPQSTPTPQATASAAGAKQGDSGALAKLGHLSARGTEGGASTGHSGPIWVIVVAVLIVLLIAPRLIRSLTRRRRWSRAAGDGPRAQAAWLELLDDLTDHKVAWSASESPRALGSRLTETLRLSPEAVAALARIVQATERARYARDPADSATLRSDTDLVRRAVSAGSGRTARWRARLVPPSSLRPVRTAMQHALDVFSWMDLAAHRTGAWSRRGPRPAAQGGQLSRRAGTLAVPLLTAAPALLEPFHEPGAGIALRPRPAVTRHARPPGRAAGHVPPARQGPHRAGEHDHEARHADEGQLGNDAGQQEAHAKQKADRRLNHPALVVHPWILRAHRLRELWILGIERTLDLIELTLFVLRQRHGASHETSRAGTGAMSSSHGPGFLFQNTSPAALVGRVVGG